MQDMKGICSVFEQLNPAVWIVTASAGARRGGLVATFVNQASLCPLLPAQSPALDTQQSVPPDLPRVVVGLARQHHTWQLIEASNAFALHLLGEEHLEWVWRFGLRSGRDMNKLEGLATATSVTGSPVLMDALGWLDCRVEARLDTGDRTIYLAAVAAGKLTRRDSPLTARRLLQLAPAERLRELKEQLVRDTAVDAAAIHSWRQQQ